MRTRILVFLLVNVLIIGFLLSSVWTLLELLVVDGASDQITRAELPAPNSDAIDSMNKVIPKIIHQTYANETIPEVWREAQASCIALHSDYEYVLWTDKKSRAFIADEYPWFLDTWDKYEYPIQRADAIRYFVLARFGGIYIDLDDGCQRRLDPLLSYPAWVRRTKPTGISNDVMGSIPGHPFFLRVIDALPSYNRNWFSPYITIMSSTGPLFLSLNWRHYSADVTDRAKRIRVLFADEYMGHHWSFFSHHVGNSWHKWDTEMIIWMSHHWIELTVIGWLIGGSVLIAIWFAYHRVFLSRNPRKFATPLWLNRFRWGPKKEYIELVNRPEV